MIMSEPLSMAQMLSSLSMRTLCAKDQRVEALADLPQELAFGTELEQLRRGRRIRRTVGAVRSREHEDVALGIDGHARDLAEIHPGRKLEEVRNGIERNLGHALLSERWSGQQHRQDEQTDFHHGLPAA